MPLPIDLEQRATATAFMYMGWAYLRSAETVLNRLDSSLSYVGSTIDHLLGQGIELLFKAQLRHAGTSAHDLATDTKYRHGLLSLLVEAKNNGLLENASALENDHLKMLDIQFGQQPYVTRYPYTGNSGPPIDALLLLGFGRRVMNELEMRLQPTRVANAGLSTSKS